MANDVFANNNEVACKAAAGKSICGFPDTCFTPPENPATPPGVPLPYPNTGLASDTTQGSRSVRISGKEVMLKNKSYFKSSYGDEAGCAAKKGMVSSVHRGKVYFIAWSMDVKVEGQNVDRHLDLTTHNHASPIANEAVPWPYLDAMGMHIMSAHCAGDRRREQEACAKYKPYGEGDPCPPETAEHVTASKANAEAYTLKVLEGESGACLKARRCALSPYKPKTCCPGQTPHHLVEASAFHAKGRGTTDPAKVNMATGANVLVHGIQDYNEHAAPCVCAEGGSGFGTHGMMHTYQTQVALGKPSGGLLNTEGKPLTATIRGKEVTEFPKTKLHEAQQNGVEAFMKTFPEAGCSPKCIYAQLRQYHERECGMSPQDEVKAVSTFSEADKLQDRLSDAEQLAQRRASVSSLTSSASNSF
jgi:hypothetical protein